MILSFKHVACPAIIVSVPQKIKLKLADYL